MSTSTNNGNQLVFDKFSQLLTGDLVGQARQDREQVGAITGLAVTKVSDTVARIATGRMNISDGTRTVTIQTQANYELTVDGTSTYIVARYTYSAVADWYADILNVSSIATNDVVLATIAYSTGAIQTINYEDRTNAKQVTDDNVFITASGKNDSLKDLLEAGTLISGTTTSIYTGLVVAPWLDEVNTPGEENVGGALDALVFDNANPAYVYFGLRTGAHVNIKFKLKACVNTAASGLVRLKLSYIALAAGVDISDISNQFSAPNEAEENFVMPTADYEMAEFESVNLKIPDTFNTTADRIILCRLERDYSDPSDTHTGSFLLFDIIPF